MAARPGGPKQPNRRDTDASCLLKAKIESPNVGACEGGSKSASPRKAWKGRSSGQKSQHSVSQPEPSVPTIFIAPDTIKLFALTV